MLLVQIQRDCILGQVQCLKLGNLIFFDEKCYNKLQKYFKAILRHSLKTAFVVVLICVGNRQTDRQIN